MRTNGRTNRWWLRGFALLGLATCSILPFGALGAIDASFDSSVAVPLLRSTVRHDAPSVLLRQLRTPTGRDGTTVARFLTLPAPAHPVLGLAGPVLLALLAAAAAAELASHLAFGDADPRGPPFLALIPLR